MLKQVRLSFDDILFDPEEASDLLTNCMCRRRKMRFVGAGAADNVLIALFEDTITGSDSKLVLAPFKSSDPDTVGMEISERYERNYLLRSSFRIKSRVWALYEVVGD